MCPARASRLPSEPLYEDGGVDLYLRHGQSEPASSPANDGLPECDIRAALDRALSDKRLRLSERNRRFLRFVTEEKLAGRAERIKSYTIAVDVFGRSPTFDSVTDPIVRIEATRLRTALSSYYEGPGAAEEVRIELPRGGYVPEFARAGTPAPGAADTAPAESPEPDAGSSRISTRALMAVAGVAAVLFGGAAAAGLFHSPSIDPEKGAPIIEIAPVQPLSANENSAEIARGLTQSLISSLSRFPGIRLVYSHGGEVPSSRSDDAQRSVYVLNSTLRASDGDLRFWWSLTDGRSKQTLWSENIDQPRDGEVQLSLEDHIAARVAARVAEPYGLVGPAQAGSRSSTGYGYTCVLQARAQLALPQPERYLPIRRCLERTIAFAPDYSDAWAMLSLNYLYESRPRRRVAGSDTDLTAAALEAAQRAVQLSPNSGLAYLALLQARFRLGDFAAAEAAATRALELNPNDPDALYAAGIRAYVRGRWDEGLRAVQKSIELGTRARPGAQFITALDAYRRGAYSTALTRLQEMKQSDYILPGILCAASHAKLGDEKGVRQHAETLRQERPDYAREFRAELAAFHFNDELIGMLVAGGRAAGLQLQ